LRREKTSEGIGYTSSWGVDFTQELKNPTDEPRNYQWGHEGLHTVVLERMRVRSDSIGEGASSVRVVKPVKTG
jgi:hypothetical protein